MVNKDVYNARLQTTLDFSHSLLEFVDIVNPRLVGQHTVLYDTSNLVVAGVEVRTVEWHYSSGDKKLSYRR